MPFWKWLKFPRNGMPETHPICEKHPELPPRPGYFSIEMPDGRWKQYGPCCLYCIAERTVNAVGIMTERQQP